MSHNAQLWFAGVLGACSCFVFFLLGQHQGLARGQEIAELARSPCSVRVPLREPHCDDVVTDPAGVRWRITWTRDALGGVP
jgi:hypothetical protein